MSRIRAGHRESADQIPSDRAGPLTSKPDWTIDGGARERAEVRDEEHRWGGKRPTSEVVEGVQVRSERVDGRLERKRFELSYWLRSTSSLNQERFITIREE